jgi:outer membrane autotransporter protein
VLTNGGAITASSKGDGAIGVEAISSHGDVVQIDNTGTIAVGAYGGAASATAISMASQGTATLHNTGSIAALGNGSGIAIASGKDASASIFNGGSVNGAIDTGDLDDSFENAAGATWRLAGSSDFGAGDDHIVNHGAMYMEGAQVVLGSYTGGNTFENFGTIVVAGSGNVIDMDNPFPIVNDGVIDLANGKPGDTLTLVGDLDGTGTIDLDASGLNGNMDRLDIQGRVFGTAHQTLNVNLLDLPNAARVEIPLLQAAGDVQGGFALGQVHYAPSSFLSLDVSLHSGADPQDAARSLLSLDVDVTGLNSVGSTAAAIAPGVQSLVDAQVGTWRQRVGVVPESNDGRLSPWVRTFSGRGDVDLAHAGNFGGGGTYGFRQSNQGLELGVDTKLSEHVNAGVLLGTSEGRQNLRGGTGSDRFDSRGVGFYATWRGGKGFYLDLSQRWNSIDAKLRSGVVNYLTGASASTFNVEAGFTAWKVGRVKIVPQAQYTHTRVEDIDALRDGSSSFAYDGGASSRGRLGVAIDGSFLGAGFVWTPYGSVNVVREFASNYGYSVNGGVLGSVGTEGTSAMVEAGLGVRKGTLSLTGGVNWTDGGALSSVTGAQFTLRYNW